MSITASKLVWEHSRQTGNNLLVLLALADHANDDLICWPGIAKIAARCRLRPRAVKAILAKLECAGEIARQFRLGTGAEATTRYTLTVRQVHGDAPVHDGAQVHGDARTGAWRCTRPVHGGAPKPSVNHQEPSEGFALVAVEPKPSKRVDRPTQAEWLAFAGTLGWAKADAEAAFDHYQAVGWLIGKKPVRDWEACARNCHRRAQNQPNGIARPTPQLRKFA